MGEASGVLKAFQVIPVFTPGQVDLPSPFHWALCRAFSFLFLEQTKADLAAGSLHLLLILLGPLLLQSWT